MTDPAVHERRHRLRRNRELVAESRAHIDRAIESGKKFTLENEIAILENEHRLVSHVEFHPYSNVALVSDEHDGPTVYSIVISTMFGG